MDLELDGGEFDVGSRELVFIVGDLGLVDEDLNFSNGEVDLGLHCTIST